MISVSFKLQMEKEIKELKSQRDLAQSRLQNLLQTVGDHAKHSVNLLPWFLLNSAIHLLISS